MSSSRIRKLTLAAMFLALAMVLPFITGQVPQFGTMLCPMHFPIFLCGYFAGPIYGLIIGFIAPYLRFALFSMPQLVPTGISMSFELAIYGLLTGLLYRLFKKSNFNTYLILLISMLVGRIVSAMVRVIMVGLVNIPYSFEIFISTNFTSAIPGIILQIILIPILVNSLKKYINE